MTVVLLALVAPMLGGCNPYAPLIGQSFTLIDEHSGIQEDTVPVIAGSDTVRRLDLVRTKNRGGSVTYEARVGVIFSSSLRLTAITFETPTEKTRLPGASSLAGVKAKSYAVDYNISGTFPFQPEQVRQLSAAEQVSVVVSAQIDLTPVQLGPKGLQAIKEFTSRFVDSDGIGNNVRKMSPRKSD